MFVQWTFGLPILEFVTLLRMDSEFLPMYAFDPETKSAVKVGSDKIAWPVAFLLMLHKKHTFRPDHKPSMKTIGEAIMNFINRIKFSCIFRDKPDNA
jgi:hypothetical protein